ncbi:phage tail tape measure protein [Viridibacillus sp. NPDC096237]|uniref:phage tail tape measure protein n=1 Tax=Viridibacillus sp. NPDC096237 TaxID=3390721 RepID=UPI003D08889D
MSRTLRNTTMRVKLDVDTRGLDDADRQLEATRRSLANLERTSNTTGGTIDNTTEAVRDLGQETARATVATNNSSASAREAGRSNRGHSQSLQERERATESVTRATDRLNSSATSSQRNMSAMRRNMGEWSRSLNDYGQQLDKLGDKLQKRGKSITKFGEDITSTFGVATLAGGAALGYSLKKAADFEQAMRDAESLMSAKEWSQSGKQLTGLVTQLGAETKYSSVEAAQGLQELIKAGVDTENILKGGLKDALNLATAGELDLAKAAEVMSTSLNAFTNDSISSTRAADLLAGAANASATDVQEMAFGLSQSAAVANGLKFEFEETSTALAVLAQNGLKGSDAGTSLKTMLMNLSPQTEAAAGKMSELGLGTTNVANGYNFLIKQGIKPASKSFDDVSNSLMKLAKEQAGAGASTTKVQKAYDKLTNSSGLVSSAFFDANGKAKDMDQIFQLLQDSLKGLSDEQKQNALKTMFGTDAVRAATIAADQGAKGYKKMNDAMQGTTAADVAEKKMKTLKGSIERMRGSAETAVTTFGTALIPTFTDLADKAESLMDWFNGLDKSTQQTLAKWSLIGIGATGLVASLGIVAIGVGGVVTAVGKLKKAGGQLSRWFSIGARGLSGHRSQIDRETASLRRNTTELNRNSSARRMQARMSNAPVAGGSIGRGSNGRRVLSRQSPLPTTTGEVTRLSRQSGSNPSTLGRAGRNGLGRVGGNGLLRTGAKLGKRVPIVGTLLGAGMLVAGGTENLGSNGGALAGGAAGAAAGAALGSVVPGVGTAIGGLIGGIAGSIGGEKFGKSLQSSIKKHLPKEGLKTDITKGVSKDTASAIKEYEKLNDKATEQLSLLQWSGEKISKKTAKSLKATYGDMAASIESAMATNFGKSEKTLTSFMKSSGLSKKEQNTIMKDLKKSHKDQKEEVKKAQEDINEIISKASKEKRELTDDDRKKINSIQRKMNKTAVRTMSKSAKEQRTIMTMLESESSKISAKQAAGVVKQSKKAREGAKKEAERKYQEVVAAADAEYKDNGAISKKQYEAIVKSAKQTRDESVSHAEDMHKKVVEQAKQQASGHLKEVDWETGEILTKWQKFKVSLAGVVNSISSGINSVLKAFGSDWEIPKWNPAGYSQSTTSPTPKSKPAGNTGASMLSFATGGSHNGGHAVVGEEGPELAYTPYGGARLVGANGAEIVDLPKGTQILTASQTAQMMSGGLKGSMPGYAKGIGSLAKSAWNTTKEVAGDAYEKVSGVASKTLDFMSDPIGAIEKMFDKASLKMDIAGIGMASLKKMKDGAMSYVQNKLSSFAGFGDDTSTGGASGSYKSLQQLAQSLSSKYGLRITSGYRPGSKNELGQPDDHSKGLAIDLAGDSASMWKAGLEAARSPLTRYVIANNRWTKNHGASWEHYPWGAHNDHVHISANASGKKLKGYAKGGYKNNHDGQVLVGEEGPELVDLPFSSQVHNNRKTNELLNNKGQTVIHFSPTVQVTVEGSKGETTESAITRAVNKALEAAFKELRGILDSGVSY